MSAGQAIQITTLPNGARIATAHMPHLRGVCVGIWAAVGGRHEDTGECGAAHFVEHLLFKGTRKRSARELSYAVEGLGGYLNAYTTEDHTCIYAKAGADHFEALAGLLLEMYQDSTFPTEEVERERGVIREEIASYRDSPSQWVEELLSEALWPRHSIGRPITGTVESVGALSRTQLKGFHNRFYCGRNTILTVSGPVTHAEVVSAVRKKLLRMEQGEAGRERRVRVSRRRALLLKGQPAEQVHLALGFHACSRTDKRRFALRLLSVILGENMSSRLFQSLRERRGYCYSVQTSTVLFRETGAFQIYADLEPSKLASAVGVIRKECARLRDVVVARAELQRAKDYIIGQTRISLDGATAQNAWMAESLMAHRRIASLSEVEAAIAGITPDQVRAIAVECLQLNYAAVALVGPEAVMPGVSSLVHD